MIPSPAPDLSDIFTHVDQHAELFLARLIDYVRHPSISSYGEGMDECAHYIADVMRQIGLNVNIMPTAGWPMVFGERMIRPELPTVLLYGHYDVQPPAPNENMEIARFLMGIKSGAAMLSYLGTLEKQKS